MIKKNSIITAGICLSLVACATYKEPLVKKTYVSAVSNALYNILPKRAVPLAAEAELTALDGIIGEAHYWEYSRSKKGSVTILRETRQLDNTLCREFHHEINLKYETKKLFGSKCKKHGKWY